MKGAWKWGLLAILAGLFQLVFIPIGTFLDPPESRDLLQLEQSPNGITYLRIRVPNVNDIAVRVVWDSHWRNWQGVNQDVPAIATRLLLHAGSAGHSAADNAERWADLRASRSLSVKWSDTTLAVDVPNDDLQTAMQMVNAELREPSLAQDWFERRRDEVAAASENALLSPASQLSDTLHLALIGDSPQRRSLSHETPESVRRLSVEDVRRWHRYILTGDPAGVIVAGDIRKKRAGQAVDALLEGLPVKSVQPPGITSVTPVLNLKPRRILLHMPQALTSRLVIAGRINGFAEVEDWFILDALAGRGGLLPTVARDKLRANYDFSWDQEFPMNKERIFRLEGEIETAKLDQVTSALRDAYAGYYRAGDPQRYAATWRRLFKTLWSARDGAADAADWVNANWWVGPGKDMLNNPGGYLNWTTPETIAKRLHDAFPKAEDLIIVAVSPDPNALPGACVITAPEQVVNCP